MHHILSAFLAFSAIPLCEAPASLIQQDEVSEPTWIELPGRLWSEYFFVEVMIEEHGPFHFLVDTGAAVTIVDPAVAEKIGRRVLERDGRRYCSFAGATCGEVDLPIKSVWVREITDMLRPYSEIPVNGVLGLDLFREMTVAMDYPSGRISVMDKDDFQYDGEGEVIPAVAYSLLHVSCEFRNAPGESMLGLPMTAVDTGAGHVLSIRPEIHEEIWRDVNANDRSSSSMTVRGMVTYRTRYVDSMRVGAFEVLNPPVKIPDTPPDWKENPSFANLGAGFLRRFNVIIDLPRLRLILEPGPTAFTPFTERPSLGLGVLLDHENGPAFRIAKVDPASLAEKAGFMENDLIVGMEGVQNDPFDLGRAREILFFEDWDRFVFHVIRGAEQEILTIEVVRD